MSEREYDILIIGATGYTGQLVIEYLANHSRASSLRIALGGRTISKVQELAAKYKNVRAVYVDVSKEPSVEEAVTKTRVVINIAGPYWTRGSVVVKACARNGVHYVDLTGEAPWVAKIIEQCVINYVLKAASNHMVEGTIILHTRTRHALFLARGTIRFHPTCGPSCASDIGKAVGRKDTLAYQLNCCTYRQWGGIWRNCASLMSAFEEVPREQMAKGLGWELSPIPAPPGFSVLPRILYSLPHITPKIWGGYFVMSTINASIVRRSWGLRYYRAPEAKRPTFSYTEFTTINGSPFWGILISLTVFIFGAAMALLPPFRWLVKNVLPKSGEGPSPDKLDKGYFGVVNVAEGGDVVVKATLDGDGDPGTGLPLVLMIVESALLLLDSENLTEIGKEGGVLTPSVAYGDALLKALEGTGRFKIGVEVLEDKKTR
ncbi:Saccharopine dehydrogenase NADP binding domain [Rhizoctonia solani]|uniref:Saccharopine dehydrogenase NADP binding domain n=1 Tax=Rhizoctonia solani TaxID=456999 RepID=A0A8H7I6I8_9AGAM|nr:Saccharopine dehydrogenase NADP binding domain [Rhizoctonia solani]